MLHQYVNYIKNQLHDKKISYKMLSQRTNISLSKLKRIFTGRQILGISDMEKIIIAAKIDNLEVIKFNNITEQKLIRLIRELSEEQQHELYNQLKENNSYIK